MTSYIMPAPTTPVNIFPTVAHSLSPACTGGGARFTRAATVIKLTSVVPFKNPDFIVCLLYIAESPCII